MPSDQVSEKKATKSSQVGAPPSEPEHLPCPRCDSTNTKFCYYNNYNFSQPRHFCKSCRRYWTHGGTLRDIPVGGGSRKNAKRSRTCIGATSNSAAASTGSVSSFSSAHHDFHHLPCGNSQLLVPFAVDHGGGLPFVGSDVKPMCGSFTSLLNTQGTGLLAFGGFGLGLEDMGYGLGKAVWPFHGAGEGGPTTGSVGMVGNTWQLESGENGFAGGGDCFSLPDLAISTPGNGMK